MKFFVSCAKGLEYLLADELVALGAARATAAVAGVNVEGDADAAWRAVLWSRLASRVLWPLAEFECPDEHALYGGAHALDWAAHLAPEGTLAVDAHVSGAAITHARYAAQRVKDAVVDRLRAQFGVRPSVDTEAPDLRLNLSLRKGRATLSVDLGGALHRRGWRQAQVDAPLKENLAAAVLLRGGWPALYADGGALLDPMCGGGTLVIEAALMAADVAPGLLRYGDAPPTRWREFDSQRWAHLREGALERERAGRAVLRTAFFGSDADPQAIRAAQANAQTAGVGDAIRWTVSRIDAVGSFPRLRGKVGMGVTPEASDTGGERQRASQWLAGAPPHAPQTGEGILQTSRESGNDEPNAAPTRGLVVCNPPYDARLAADPALYRTLGDALRRDAPAWRAALLCGSEELAYATGLRAGKRYMVFNGALECTLIVCDPIAPAPRVRDDSAPPPLSEGAQMVANRLRKNIKRLKSWREREGVGCWRVYDADLPEYAAAIDVYEEESGEVPVAAARGERPWMAAALRSEEAAPTSSRIWLHVQEYAAPAEIPEADARRRWNELLAAARDVFALPRERIALKTRARGKGGARYGRMAERGEFLVVREGAVRLHVNLFDYLDTGLFLDHRPLRLRIAREAAGRRFLNLFCYTGAVTAHAAAGGAARTTSVDLSATYLDWAARNLRLNGIAGPAHSLVQADALAWLEADRGDYDLVFCDPPTFSNSARAADFDVQKTHVRLLRAALARLAPGGLLVFSNNYRRFRLDEAALADIAEIREISADTIPPDFARNPRIHRAWELRRRR